jgi:Spy/CpxP family protein refolding chaperone
MKKYLIALSAFTLMAINTNAQSDNSTPSRPDKQMRWHNHKHSMDRQHSHYTMMKNLNLSDAQKQQVKALNEDYKSKLNNLQKNDNITLKDYRLQKASFDNERKAKFADMLTAEQKNKIAKAKIERQEKMKMISQKRIEKMKTDLNLTDDQVAKIQDQKSEMRSQAQSIRENNSLTHEQKKEQFMMLKKTHEENVNKILTADQLRKREELRNNRIKNNKDKWDNNAS